MTSSREKEIIKLLQDKSPLKIEELARLLQVSEPTVRRDLIAMERKGLILRERGGASLPGLGVEPLFTQRQNQNHELKRNIAKYAASLVKPGDVIALDAGTTTVELAKELLKLENLTVFTYSMPVAFVLTRSLHDIYVIGGHLRKSEQSMVGNLAMDMIRQFNFDYFFMGLGGFNEENGPTDYILDEVEMKRLIIQRSKKVIALADISKFDNASLVKVCEYEEIDEIVTNIPEKDERERLRFHSNITLV
ncbi:DeoR/GlpR family DNA-binding transcription regulator [Paenibacillus sp. S150]|uniref:DeoR/GlpR family DNA-binding transcription regulator n=1 Tax=Paenibacillus sp. S150 TaxID=2749826 RepID=UPI001C59AD6D|nr:DeoR/GlpR family DNA-binding transcription regulator [Paenibacillus sp. S150]MBW4081187.1 DeoR/GlpR transcriptional regulator [Paenibacillus sp. S150]